MLKEPSATLPLGLFEARLLSFSSARLACLKFAACVVQAQPCIGKRAPITLHLEQADAEGERLSVLVSGRRLCLLDRSCTLLCLLLGMRF